MITEEKLGQYLRMIKPLAGAAMDEARAYQARLAKPPGSLGRLEELSVQMAGITGTIHNFVEKTAIFVFAADNGVVEEGVSSAPQSVTLQQSVNMTLGKTGASAIARDFGCPMFVCDVGINANVSDCGIISRKLGYGTQNIARGPAMSRVQTLQAVSIGLELVLEKGRNLHAQPLIEWIFSIWLDKKLLIQPMNHSVFMREHVYWTYQMKGATNKWIQQSESESQGYARTKVSSRRL